MATLVVVTHEYDRFTVSDGTGKPLRSPYLLYDVLRHLTDMGHKCRVVQGAGPIPGDVALLHVDATIVTDEYLGLASHYPRTINFGTGDISKRKISRLLVARDDGWTGPVLVKSNFNNNALLEQMHNARAAYAQRPLPHPGIAKGPPYQLFDSAQEVPAETWSDDSLVVERFVPEKAPEGGYALRTWVFMGPRERCNRVVTAGPISKAADVLSYGPVDVPPQLRAERERLNFDFGKFDFVIHDGEPILLDANRTPGVARAIQPLIAKGALNLAEGLNALVTG
jgi:hypothetical protein